jgi:hypothetical protein
MSQTFPKPTTALKLHFIFIHPNKYEYYIINDSEVTITVKEHHSLQWNEAIAPIHKILISAILMF